jgi:dihydroflavonol-4-reductase
VLQPSLVIGPAIAYTNEINISTWILQLICDGTIPVVIDLGFPFVDVRGSSSCYPTAIAPASAHELTLPCHAILQDAAKAHILAMENPNAKGRYIIHGDTVTMGEVCDVIRRKFPNHRIATIPFTGKKITAAMKFFLWLYRSGVTDYIRTSMGKCSFFPHSTEYFSV